MKHEYILIIIAAQLVAACSNEEATQQAPPDPVVVYVAYEDSDAIRARFDRYSEATGIEVIDRRGVTAAIVDDLIENRISPPADLLVTRSVAPAWRAAEESALRPLFSESLVSRLPAWAMDPDKLWFAIATNRAVIAYSGDEPVSNDVADLAHDRYRGRLCLSSSQHAINMAVIAGLLDTMPVRSAEIIVRGWVQNLAQHPFATEDELAAAIASGECSLGIVAARVANRSGLSYVEPASAFVDIEAVGVGRHARNPDGATKLAEWLVGEFEMPAGASYQGANVTAIAQQAEEAVKLAERARYF